MMYRLLVASTLFLTAFTSLAMDTASREKNSISTELLAEDVRPSVLQREIKKAQINFYKAFNKVNDIDELDIVCKRRFNYSPNIKHKFCEPVWSRKIRFNNDRQITAIAEHSRIRQMTKEKNVEAIAHFHQIMGQNPELRDMYTGVRTLIGRYEQLTGKKRKTELNWASIPFWGFTLEP